MFNNRRFRNFLVTDITGEFFKADFEISFFRCEEDVVQIRKHERELKGSSLRKQTLVNQKVLAKHTRALPNYNSD